MALSLLAFLFHYSISPIIKMLFSSPQSPPKSHPTHQPQGCTHPHRPLASNTHCSQNSGHAHLDSRPQIHAPIWAHPTSCRTQIHGYFPTRIPVTRLFSTLTTPQSSECSYAPCTLESFGRHAYSKALSSHPSLMSPSYADPETARRSRSFGARQILVPGRPSSSRHSHRLFGPHTRQRSMDHRRGWTPHNTPRYHPRWVVLWPHSLYPRNVDPTFAWCHRQSPTRQQTDPNVSSPRSRFCVHRARHVRKWGFFGRGRTRWPPHRSHRSLELGRRSQVSTLGYWAWLGYIYSSHMHHYVVTM